MNESLYDICHNCCYNVLIQGWEYGATSQNLWSRKETRGWGTEIQHSYQLLLVMEKMENYEHGSKWLLIFDIRGLKLVEN
jgi:hypothetical protein